MSKFRYHSFFLRDVTSILHTLSIDVNSQTLIVIFQMLSYFVNQVLRYHGAERLVPSIEFSTKFVLYSANPRWNEALVIPILVADLPKVMSQNFPIISNISLCMAKRVLSQDLSSSTSH